jgi:hypothetical protein
MRTEIPVKGVGEQRPSFMDEVPCSHKDIKGIPFDEIAGGNMFV